MKDLINLLKSLSIKLRDKANTITLSLCLTLREEDYMLCLECNKDFNPENLSFPQCPHCGTVHEIEHADVDHKIEGCSKCKYVKFK